MPSGGRPHSCTEYYHVMCRGVARQIIFEDDSDRCKLLGLIEKHSQEDGIAVNAYCLMDNHYHLLLKGDLCSLSHFMGRVGSEYARYFNWKYDRSGSLFQGRFKSECIENESYFLTVLRYILRNPEEAGIAKMDEYPWNNYAEYRDGGGFTDIDFAIHLCGSWDLLDSYLRIPGKYAPFCEAKGKARTESIIAFIDSELKMKRSEFQRMSRDARDHYIKILRAEGYPIRQIERATGVSRATVQRICKK